MSIEALIEGMQAHERDAAGRVSTPEDLLAASRIFKTQYTFAVGDIVEWKPQMKNRRSPGPFVVMEVLDTPVMDDAHDSGTPYYREPLDLVLGQIDGEGDFMTLHYDSRRFQPHGSVH